MTLKSLSHNLMIFLVYVGPTLASQIQPVSSTNSIFHNSPNLNLVSTFITPCTISEVIDTINNLHNCKGIGFDGFFTSVIKSVSNYIAEPLTHIFNLSFTSGVFLVN